MSRLFVPVGRRTEAPPILPVQSWTSWGESRLSFDDLSEGSVQFGHSLYQFGDIPGEVLLHSSLPQQFTLEFWMETPDPADSSTEFPDYRRIFRSQSHGNFILLEEPGNISFRIPGVDISYWSAAQDAYPWQVPVHITCVYDQADRIIYVNGIEDGRDAVGPGVIDSAPLTISEADLPGRNFEGRIWEVRLWDHPRSEAQLQAGMHQSIDPASPGLVGYWVGTMEDLTGNHPDPTPEGYVRWGSVRL